jgi:phytoene/squalene synthetase
MPEEDIFALLPAVSRTFALSINALLPRACRKALKKGREANPSGFARAFKRKDAALASDIALAYLLCRLLDTIEDDNTLPAKKRASLLRALGRALADAEHEEKTLAELGGAAPEIQAKTDEKELLQKAAPLFARLRKACAAHSEAICRHASEMAYGMADSVTDDARGRIQTRADLDRYCHYVAGTVGAMLSDLFIAQRKKFPPKRAKILRANMESFARGLQLVNIIKDCQKDFAAGRCFIPAEIVRASGLRYEEFFAVMEVGVSGNGMDAESFDRGSSTEVGASGNGMDAESFDRGNGEEPQAAGRSQSAPCEPEMAKSLRSAALLPLIEDASGDLDRAVAYTCALPRRMRRARLFCILPIALARATLNMLKAAHTTPRKAGEKTPGHALLASPKISRRRVILLVLLSWPAAVSNLWLRLLCGSGRGKN